MPLRIRLVNQPGRSNNGHVLQLRGMHTPMHAHTHTHNHTHTCTHACTHAPSKLSIDATGV